MQLISLIAIVCRSTTDEEESLENEILRKRPWLNMSNVLGNSLSSSGQFSFMAFSSSGPPTGDPSDAEPQSTTSKPRTSLSDSGRNLFTLSLLHLCVSASLCL